MNFNNIVFYKREYMKKIIVLALFFTTATQAFGGKFGQFANALYTVTNDVTEKTPATISKHPLKSAAALLIIGHSRVIPHLLQNNLATSLVGAGSFGVAYATMYNRETESGVHTATYRNSRIFAAAALGALATPLAYKTATATASLAQKTGNFIAANVPGTLMGAVAGFMIGSLVTEKISEHAKKENLSQQLPGLTTSFVITKGFFAVTGGLTGAALFSYLGS